MMGARLVSQVFTHWKHLPDRPFRLLCHMALTCKDAHEEPTYWAGRDDLADALGLEPGEPAYQAVKRALRQIIAAGAARIAYQGHARKNTEYALTLDKMPHKKGVTNRPPNSDRADEKGGHSPTPEGGHSVTRKGVTQRTNGGHSPTPLGRIGNTQENSQEETRVSDASGTRARGRVATADDARLKLVREKADAEAAS